VAMATPYSQSGSSKHVSYQVLARKWRPKTFSQLVGQDHVVKVLSHGLAQGRIHHAFLFTGTRGVGKTTIARILAKSLNCLEGISAEPCGVCAHCVAIDEGRFVDLLEIDAASKTKVDDTRDILDNVQYAPAQGRFKVYLIDEIHMLSTHSFNALLKTLEEPPDHVKFVLATTDPQKIPVTILSRCLQFNLRRLSVDQIAEQMQTICQSEQVEAPSEALRHLAVAADGSMRDGLSLLDQALASDTGLTEASVVEMLGNVEQRHVHGLLQALASNKPKDAIEIIDEVFSQARDMKRLLSDLAEALHRIGLILQLPDYRDDTRTDWDALVALAAQFDPEDVQLFYQITVTGRRDLELAPSLHVGCQMTMLRLFAFQPAKHGSSGPSSASSGQVLSDVKAPLEEQAGTQAGSSAQIPSQATPQEALAELTPECWPRVLESLPINGSVKAVAGLLVIEAVARQTIRFSVAADDKILITTRFEEALGSALSKHFGEEVKILISSVAQQQTQTPAEMAHQELEQAQLDAHSAIEGDPVIQKLKKRFDAQVLPESVRPVDTRSH